MTAGYHSGAIDEFGNMYIWGSGSFGELLKPKKIILSVPIKDISITAAINRQLIGINAQAITALTAVDHSEDTSPHFTKVSHTLYSIKNHNAYRESVLINCQNLKSTSDR